MRGRTWATWATASVGLVAVAAYLVLPAGGVAAAAIVIVFCAGAWSMVAWRIVSQRRELHWAWWVFLAGGLLYVVATVLWQVVPLVGTLGYPTAIDGLYWASYLTWGLFLVTLMRSLGALDRTAILDSVVVASALLALGWQFILQPAIDHSNVGVAQAFATIMYPLLVLLLATVVIRMGILRRRPSVDDALLWMWILTELATDIWYALASAQGWYSAGSPWTVGWLASWSFLAVFAARNGFAAVSLARADDRSPRPAAVVAMLGVCALIPMLIVFGPHDPSDELARVVLQTVLLGALVARLWLLFRDEGMARARADELVRTGEEMSHLARHDALTGLPNRAAFDDALRLAMSRRRAPGRVAAVMLVDLDAFKAVNDLHGHGTGDALLQVTAVRLLESAREADTVCRIGGDEFAIVVDDTDPTGALSLAERAVAAVCEPWEVNGLLLRPGASMGLCLSEPGMSPEQALSNADAAMYSAKSDGGGLHLFDVDRHRDFLDRFELELDLRSAAAQGQLVLHYQPIVELATRRIVGVEGLLRWNHPRRGLLQPGDFLPVAEHSGAILEIGRWTFLTGCRDATRMLAAVPAADGLTVSLNLSARQLASPTLVGDLRHALDQSGLRADRLMLEIGDSSLGGDRGDQASVLRDLKALGVLLALDSLGLGSFPLSQLRQLPIDVVKVGRSYVDRISTGEDEWHLTVAILGVARSVHATSVAVGVEDAAQLAHLRSLRCDRAQGNLFGEPMPLARVLEVLAEQ